MPAAVSLTELSNATNKVNLTTKSGRDQIFLKEALSWIISISHTTHFTTSLIVLCHYLLFLAHGLATLGGKAARVLHRI